MIKFILIWPNFLQILTLMMKVILILLTTDWFIMCNFLFIGNISLIYFNLYKLWYNNDEIDLDNPPHKLDITVS
jgi:hypothetical protein